MSQQVGQLYQFARMCLQIIDGKGMAQGVGGYPDSFDTGLAGQPGDSILKGPDRSWLIALTQEQKVIRVQRTSCV